MYRAISGMFVLTLVFVFSFGAFAQAADLKIGIANLPKVAAESKANKDAEKQLKDTFSAERDQLDKLGAEIEKLTDEMKKQASALSGEAKQAKRAQLVQMMRDHNDRSRAFVSKVKDAETVIRNEIMAAVIIASKEYALKNGYTLILDSSQAGVLYSADSMDVTADLLKEVDIVWETAARNKK